MSEWKCSYCGKIYNINEFISLKKIKLVESDTDPAKQHGYTPVCECGYRFYLDRWRKNDNITIKLNGKELELLVSSIFLELNHKIFDDKYEYYETAILWLDNDEAIKNVEVMQRYETKKEAIENHNKILNLIKEGKYKIDKVKILENEEYCITLSE